MAAEKYITVGDIRTMVRGIDAETKAIITQKGSLVATFNTINDYLHEHGLTKADLSPRYDLVFRAFAMTPLSKIRAVLIGQDPYIHEGEATGLSFSVPREFAVPPSLRAIYRCLVARNLVNAEPKHGDLSAWARQGVLLLNVALTTVIGKSNEHATIWKPYSIAVISAISAARPEVPFILLGAEAQRLEFYLKSTTILKWGHPSPLNRVNSCNCAANFVNCDVFEQIVGINWDPDVAPKECIAFTDGACRGNGKGEKSAASWAYVLYDSSRNEIGRGSGRVETAGHKGSIIHATNNRGELLAILGVLRAAAGECDKLKIVTDSEYSIGCITEWYDKWLRENLADTKKNTDILADIAAMKIRFSALEFMHIRSHESVARAGQEWEWEQNALVDKLATDVIA